MESDNTMASLGEMKDKGYIPQTLQVKLMLGGAISLTKTIITTRPKDFRRLRTTGSSDEQYIRPPRAYTIPKYKEGMKFCDSEEKYLRPTLFCNHKAPEVVALANQLGAFKKSDYEFAKSAFHFVKEKMPLEILPFNPVEETFTRGTGTCFHLITCFIALCRAAGIKARYKVFAMNMIQAWYDGMAAADPLVKKWYDSMGYFMLEGEGEAYIDGKWVVAHVGPKAERQAAAGIPITTFGEDSLGNWFTMVPGTLMRMESISYGLGGATKILERIAPGSMERVNSGIQKQIAMGAKIIKDAGGLEAYDRQARMKKGPEGPEVKLKTKKEIVFED